MRSFRGVRGGTPTGPPLCRTCRNAHYRFGAKQHEALLFCDALGSKPMPFEVYDCSDYDDARLETPYQIQERAWLLVELGDGKKKWMPSDEYNRMLSTGKVKRLRDIDD